MLTECPSLSALQATGGYSVVIPNTSEYSSLSGGMGGRGVSAPSPRDSPVQKSHRQSGRLAGVERVERAIPYCSSLYSRS